MEEKEVHSRSLRHRVTNPDGGGELGRFLYGYIILFGGLWPRFMVKRGYALNEGVFFLCSVDGLVVLRRVHIVFRALRGSGRGWCLAFSREIGMD